jgi:hypothetical protein
VAGNRGRLALAHAMNGAAEAAVASARGAGTIAARSPHTAVGGEGGGQVAEVAPPCPGLR